MLEILEPGLLSTIQDAGRPAAMHLGVPRGGAADPAALRQMGHLVDASDPPSVEMTLLGATFAVRETCLVAVTGSDFDASIVEEDRPLLPGTATVVRAGTTLRFGQQVNGARAYLSLNGGIDVPRVLGSASTCLAGRFGGIEGRPLRAGDLLRPARRGALEVNESMVPGRPWGIVEGDGPRLLRVVLGPHAGLLGGRVVEALLTSELEVSHRSDRVGVRLDDLGDSGGIPADNDLVSLPVVWGALQLPPGGQPICLLPDHQTVGGYPVPLVVASADRPMLGQLRALDRVRFQRISLEEARQLAESRARPILTTLPRCRR